MQGNWYLINRLNKVRKKSAKDMPQTKRAALLLTLGGVRGAVTLAGTLSIPLFIDAKLGIPFLNVI